MIDRTHGSDAPRWIAERIGELALLGDDSGVERFRQIAARLDAMSAARRRPQ